MAGLGCLVKKLALNVYFDITLVSEPKFTVEPHGVGYVFPKFDLQSKNLHFSPFGESAFICEKIICIRHNEFENFL
jgi:hypothetical protein